jgi:2-polyprenyl-3-methyl-5-hydroxy-6-metoxy-1,4-benzoquinol methylase
MPTLQSDMKNTAGARQVSPAPIFDTLNRYQHTMALKGAIDLDLFTHIGGGASTASSIASQCQASERGVRILCDFLTIIGFLTKIGDHYELTPESDRFLNKRSLAYCGGISSFLVSERMLENFSDVAAMVRNGGTIDTTGGYEKETEHWVHFARVMTPVTAMAAQMVAPKVSQPGRKQKVLDIAAGSGIFGISVALTNPEAEIVALDWSNVLEVAKENASRAGIENRFRTLAGDAFKTDFGSGYDLVLVPNFLHHFDEPTSVQFLKRVRAAMNPGARLATVEFVPNEDRISPPVAASFSLMMLGNTENGDTYTFHQFDQMFRKAGFGESISHDLLPSPLTLIITKS